jgi:undecaprenyl-diphosphatase
VQAWAHARSSPALTRVMETLTVAGKPSCALPLCALAAWWLWARLRRREATLLLCSMLGAGVLDTALKLHFKRTRPEVAWRWGHEHSYSFPSGHSMAAVVMYGTLLYIVLGMLRSAWARAAACVAALALALGIGYSRIYLGAHWPTDVLAGYVAGLVWVAGVVAADLWACRGWPWRRRYSTD